MKLVTFVITTKLGLASRIGALITDNQLIDLNFSFAAKLHADGNTERFYQIADALVPNDLLEFIKGGQESTKSALCAIDFIHKQLSTTSAPLGPNSEVLVHALDNVKLLAPIPKPTSIRDTISFETHAKNFEKRTGIPTPDLWYERPIYYKGNPGTVVGHNSPILWPDYTNKLDYELEFGIYIGKTGKNISAQDAQEYIAGYTIFNDISARDILQKEVQVMLGPSKGKDMDNGNIMGPCLVTPDELEAGNLDMKARINGELWSQGNSSDMYWSFAQIIEYISKSETLHPGDFIGSGTIAFGCGDELDRWIKPGDIIELEVEGIGILRNQVALNP